MKELKGDDESEEEWDRLQWGSLHGLAEDKRNGGQWVNLYVCGAHHE